MELPSGLFPNLFDRSKIGAFARGLVHDQDYQLVCLHAGHIASSPFAEQLTWKLRCTD
jgi:hypothetical protein